MALTAAGSDGAVNTMEISQKLSEVLTDLNIRKVFKAWYPLSNFILRETSNTTEEEHIQYSKLMVKKSNKNIVYIKETF